MAYDSFLRKRREISVEIQRQMLFKKSIHKTKHLFLKTVQNLKKFLFGSYEKLPRTLFFNPLSCSSINQRGHHLDLFYSQFCNHSVSDDDQDNTDHSVKHSVETQAAVYIFSHSAAAIDENHTNGIGSSCEKASKMKEEVASRTIEPSSAASSCRHADDRAYILARKMKELEMMQLSDVDHALDVEEALHYYSRLTCPIFVDIVNKFFMDMYSEFLLPQPAVSLSTSSRRLSPLKL